MTEHPCIAAARVRAIAPQMFGAWLIECHDLRRYPNSLFRRWAGFDRITSLKRYSMLRAHLDPKSWECVMEDSLPELRKHLPIFERACGRVLVTGLGLGCVVRGLLAKQEVETIDVVEIDRDILRVVGTDLARDPRVTLHHGDALKIEFDRSFDFAWHDLWTEGPDHLQLLHGRLFVRFAKLCRWQGAWQFPGNLARRLPWNQRVA